MFIRENAAHSALHPVGKMTHLEALGEQGHYNTGAHQQYQHGQTPDEAVHRAVDLFDDFQESLHNISPLPEKNMDSLYHSLSVFASIQKESCIFLDIHTEHTADVLWFWGNVSITLIHLFPTYGHISPICEFCLLLYFIRK